MSKNKSIIFKFTDGNSDEIIELLEIGNVKYVKKTWKDKIRGSEAIKKQILFEEIISGQVRIKTPKVIDKYLDNQEKFVAIMEYVEGFSGSELHKISTTQLANNLRYALSLIISNFYEQSYSKKIEPEILLNKLDMVRKKTKLKDISGMLNIIERYILRLNEIYIPLGSCHGDLTTSNVIATGSSTFYLIDFLPTFLDTPFWDILKLKQDLEYGWSTRHLSGHALNNARILNDFLIPHQMKKFHENFGGIGDLFDSINLCRLAPYVKDEITKKWVSDKLLYSTNKLL